MQLAWDDLAVDELRQAKSWYAEHAPEQVERLLDEVLAAEELIERLPHAWNPIDPKFRAFRLNHFPYSIIYRTQTPLTVVAFIHQKRRPGFWKSR